MTTTPLTHPRPLNCLGMTLVDPTDELLRRYAIEPEGAGPIVVAVSDPSYFLEDTVPPVGASFWIVTFSMFFFSPDKPEFRRRHRIPTTWAFAHTIWDRSLPPEDYARLTVEASNGVRARANASRDPIERA